MKNLLFTLLMLSVQFVLAQTDKDKLALAIHTADEVNMQKLKSYIWKRKSEVSIDGQVKLTTLTKFSFDEHGKVQAKLVDAESSVMQKPGVRRREQQSAAEDKAEYVQKALELSLAYTYMTKGQLMDFFAKATVTEQGETLDATGENVYVQGDKLTIVVDKKTNLYMKKSFTVCWARMPWVAKSTMRNSAAV